MIEPQYYVGDPDLEWLRFEKYGPDTPLWFWAWY